VNRKQQLESGDPEMTFDWSGTSKLPQIARAIGYWHEKRGDRAMPARRDIVPSEIRDILPFIQLYDMLDGAAGYRVRLLGTEVARAFEQDLTGQVFDHTSTHPLVIRTLAVFGQVVKQRKPLIARADRTAIDKLSYAPIESAFLPLSENGVDVDVIFAATIVLKPQDRRHVA
jgi:hypothetical protein